MIDVFIATCLAGILIPFVLYPLVLWLHAVVAPAPVAEADVTPKVDLLIAAHDEQASIAARLENALSLDYPRDRLTIWVASDGSSDATVEIARRFEPRGVRVLDLPRGGKAAALIAAVEASRDSGASVLAFSDANSDWRRDALRQLVRPMADESVGGVAGDQRYVASDRSADGAVGERSYWSFDRQLKRWQTRAGNAISATGAIYAIRRELFEPPPPDATDDFMISTGVIAQGRRLVFAEEAVAFEPPAEASGGEFRRKVRIITRGLRAVGYRRALLRPSRTGFYAIELLLHKLWRRLTWIPLLLLVLAAPVAFAAALPLALASLGAAAAVALGALGLARPALARLRIVSVASYLVMVNAACAWATLNALRGHRVARWDTERPAAASAESLR